MPELADTTYRYWLARGDTTNPAHNVTWVMFNPSTADDVLDDPTIRRVKAFSAANDYNGLYVVNLYAARATKPKHLTTMTDPVGPENDDYIRRATANSSAVIFAWGAYTHPNLDIFGRIQKVVDNLPQVCTPMCLGTTKAGMPRHPLYVRAVKPFEVWS